MSELTLFLFFIVKHFIVDFTKLQSPYMYLNKGIYGHPGGIIHAFLHAVVSLPVMVALTTPFIALGVCLFEFLIHYHMDWFKIWLCKRKKWGPTTSPYFWTMLGVDQMVHYLTYVYMIAMVI